MVSLKDLFRKSKSMENVQKKAEKNIPEKKEEKKKGKAVRERRYSFLVEEVFETSHSQGIMVLGTIHGKIREGDTMYLYRQEQPVREVHVLTIERGPRDVVQMARNVKVGLCLDLESTEEISRFSVLSSVKPVEGELANRLIENPRLFGLMMEYRRLYTNSVYMDALLYELCQAKFVVPLYMDRPPLPRPDGTFAFSEDAHIGFRPLKKADDSTQTVFPAFTDEIALASWKGAYHEGQPRRLATMMLPHLIGYVEKGHAGLVINPFGPEPVYFPKELLEQVEQSNVFQMKYQPKQQTESEKG